MLEGEGVPDSVRAVARGLDIGNYSQVFAPMQWEGKGIGALYIIRQPVNAFSDKEVALLETFADQAVIAIQNARLFNDTQEALQQQTASAEVLKVISESPSDVQPVFNAIMDTAYQLSENCSFVSVVRCEPGSFRQMAFRQGDKISREPSAKVHPIDPRANLPSRVIQSKSMLHIPDWAKIELPAHDKVVQAETGARSSLFLSARCLYAPRIERKCL